MLCLCQAYDRADPFSRKQAVKKSVFVNIIDFFDHGPLAKRFPNKLQLAEYSKAEDKIFPLREAKGSPVLKALLIDMYAARKRANGIGRGPA